MHQVPFYYQYCYICLPLPLLFAGTYPYFPCTTLIVTCAEPLCCSARATWSVPSVHVLALRISHARLFKQSYSALAYPMLPDLEDQDLSRNCIQNQIRLQCRKQSDWAFKDLGSQED